MLDIFFVMLAAGMNGLGTVPPADTSSVAPDAPPIVAQDQGSVVINNESVVIGQNTVVEGQVAPANSEFDMSVVPAGLKADSQTPSGKFLTATEVRPILEATKSNWVAVRDYDGQDWLYVTHLWSWRCGLKAIAISVNGEGLQDWPMPQCHEQFTTPNAVLEDDGLPVLTFRQNSVQTITIQIVYDDLSMDIARFERGNVLIP